MKIDLVVALMVAVGFAFLLTWLVFTVEDNITLNRELTNVQLILQTEKKDHLECQAEGAKSLREHYRALYLVCIQLVRPGDAAACNADMQKFYDKGAHELETPGFKWPLVVTKGIQAVY